jgi:DUF971 family protein
MLSLETMSTTPPIPQRLALKKDLQLEIRWSDGLESVYPVRFLRAKCPCAACREFRDKAAKTRLMVLNSTHDGPIVATSAQMVGNYAIRIDFSDGHVTGIYSFEYLRELAETMSKPR